MAVNRREFVSGAGAFAAAGVVGRLFAGQAEDALDVWQRETDCVKAEVFRDYMEDGDTRGLASLEKLERAFEKVFREARETAVGDVPAVWSVYNMGYVVKTRESLFSIDLVHRRALELFKGTKTARVAVLQIGSEGLGRHEVRLALPNVEGVPG